jgi:hypothetical protein
MILIALSPLAGASIVFGVLVLAALWLSTEF